MHLLTQSVGEEDYYISRHSGKSLCGLRHHFLIVLTMRKIITEKEFKAGENISKSSSYVENVQVGSIVFDEIRML